MLHPRSSLRLLLGLWSLFTLLPDAHEASPRPSSAPLHAYLPGKLNTCTGKENNSIKLKELAGESWNVTDLFLINSYASFWSLSAKLNPRVCSPWATYSGRLKNEIEMVRVYFGYKQRTRCSKPTLQAHAYQSEFYLHLDRLRVWHQMITGANIKVDFRNQDIDCWKN